MLYWTQVAAEHDEQRCDGHAVVVVKWMESSDVCCDGP